MTERDVFEVRLATAVRGYAGRVSSELDAIELAHRIATSEPRRHGFAARLRWRGVSIQRSTWILLLLAALLTALVAGMLVAGSEPAPRLPAVVPPVPAVVPPVGPALACPPGSSPDEPGPVNQMRPPGAGPLAFDRVAGKIVMLEGAETWAFDVCSNNWTLMQSGWRRPTGLALVYDPGAELVIGVDYPEHPAASPPHAWAYSFANNTWTRRGPAPEYVARLWYDAASAQVTAWATASDQEPGTLWTYDVASDAWAAVGELEVLGGYGWNTPGDLLAYDAGLDRVVVTDPGGDRTRLLDVQTGTVLDARALAPWAGACGWFVSMYCYGGVAGAAIAYDDHAVRTVFLVGGNLFAYDAAAGRWDTLYGPGDTSAAVASSDAAFGALARESWSMVWDPLNGRLVVPGGAGGTVLAFDSTTREWTVLLERSESGPRGALK